MLDGVEHHVVGRIEAAIAPLIAVALLLGMTPAIWTAATSLGDDLHPGSTGHPEVHAVVVVLVAVCCAALLVAALLAIAGLARRVVELLVLASGVALTLSMLAVATSQSDEGLLTNRAATALLRGQSVYGVQWREVFASSHVAQTPTMAGGIDFTYGYPPFAALLTAGFRVLFGHASQAVGIVATLALLAGVVGGWLLVPSPWKSLVPGLALGTAMLPGDARGGYPATIAFALLVPVVAHWDRIGAAGRVRLPDLGRGIALGLACATHQLAWFAVPFLVVALWRTRVAQHGARRSRPALAAFVGAAAIAFAAVNLPFLLASPIDWLEGIALPIFQHAILHGQGLVAISFFLTGGTGDAGAFGIAQDLVIAGLLVLLALFPARLGPAWPLLPMLSFLVGTRSSDEYLILYLPLVLLAVLTTDAGALPAPLLRGRWVPVAITASLVPATLAGVVALATPPPFTGSVEAVVRSGSGRIEQATLTLVNRSGTAITPHVVARAGTHPTLFWTAHSGPTRLAPGERGVYVLAPPSRAIGSSVGAAGSRAVFMVFSDAPMTLTTVRFPR